MTEAINLSGKIEKQLPVELINFMQAAGKIATEQNWNLYLVGGVVRDLLLGVTNLDLDLVVEGDAINLTQQLMQSYPGKITAHPRFGTAKLKWDKWSADFTTVRSETYARPGALPNVKPSSIEIDLFRRDFTINAMAIELNPARYGNLIDLYGGRNDLNHGFIRILHDKSFVDDATRIWRGLRYEQRLDFKLEPDTLNLMQRDIPMLDTISSDRIRYELECILKEEYPEKVIRRAGELGVLTKLHPSFSGDGWLAEKFDQARQLSPSDLPSTGLYLALLTYRLNNEEVEQFISYLRLSKFLCQVLRDTSGLKAKLDVLANPRLTPSRIYHHLHDYSTPAITANSLVSDSPVVLKHIRLFLNKLQYVRPALTGNDLQKMGISPGLRMKEILERLHEARLDGKVASKKGEEELVRHKFLS